MLTVLALIAIAADLVICAGIMVRLWKHDNDRSTIDVEY
jgi:hypothetical protein